MPVHPKTVNSATYTADLHKIYTH